MKKILLLLALCATVFVACSDDDDKDDNGNKQKLVSKIVTTEQYSSETDVYTTTFEYNSEGKITKVVDTYDDGQVVTRTFKKEGKKLTATYDNSYSGKGDRVLECELNDKGFIIKGADKGSYDFKNITYNEKGQLIQIDDKFTFEWLNDNIISLDSKYEGSPEYTYTEYENKTNYDFGWQLISIWEYDMYETSYLGVKSKNLIATEGDYYTYEYTFDKEGYVTSAKQYEIKDGQKKLVNTQNITYKE